MDSKALSDTAKMLVADDKGLLAIDESTPTCNKRFDEMGISPSLENRRAYREWIIKTPGLVEFISGMILYDETIRQQDGDGYPFDEVADATVECFLRVVPAAVPGIAFLSGGQSGELASARLNAMQVRFAGQMPWGLSFSFARAIQQPALAIWHGEQANVPAAQQALYHRAQCNHAARRGLYTREMEWAIA